MGGIGSGRRRGGGRPLVEDAGIFLNERALPPEGVVTFQFRGARLACDVGPDTVLLALVLDSGAFAADEIPFTRLPLPRWGGERRLLACGLCTRPSARLFLDAVRGTFGCRRCVGLSYWLQRRTVADRLTARA